MTLKWNVQIKTSTLAKYQVKLTSMTLFFRKYYFVWKYLLVPCFGNAVDSRFTRKHNHHQRDDKRWAVMMWKKITFFICRYMRASMEFISVKRIYIGLTLIRGSWIWADSSPANGVPWYPKQPSGGENCAELLEYRGSFGINDIPCKGLLTKGALCAVKLT